MKTIAPLLGEMWMPARLRSSGRLNAISLIHHAVSSLDRPGDPGERLWRHPFGAVISSREELLSDHPAIRS
jgi:hypothetical protein